MAAHRYWRLRVLEAEDPTDSGLDLSSLELFDSTGVNAATTGNGTASASSGTTPAAAFDGNVNTYWNCPTPTFPQWLAWDFGAGNAKQIIGFRAYLWTGSNHPGRSVVEFSDDGSAWTPMFFMPRMSNPLHNIGLDFTSYVQSEFSGDIPVFSASGTSPSLSPAVAPMLWAVVEGAALRGPKSSTIPFANWWNGASRITGTVMADVNGDGVGDVNLQRRVYLIDEASQVAVEARWSHPATGAYSFDYIRTGPGVAYTVLAYDYERNYRAVVADNLTAEAMP